jgi:Icc-related predicted phosphoesterase
MDRVKLPKIGVHGNHDEHGTLDALGVEDVHLRRVEIGDWSFAGFAGCVKYGRGPFQFTQREAAKLAKRLPAADVLVCHCPPSGVNDEPDDCAHHGFEALRAWAERHRPRYILHGHTTPDPRTRVHRFGDAQVVWVRGSRVVELRDA